MALLDVLRIIAPIAHGVFQSAEASLWFYRRLQPDEDGYGTKRYAGKQKITAIVEQKQRQVKSPTGVIAMSDATIIFLDVPRLKIVTKGLGVSIHDRIVLPNGKTQPIVGVGGFIDAGTGQPLATEAYLG